MRPITVPAGICEPTLRCLMTIWSLERPSARAGVSAPSMRPVRRNSCCAPPAVVALARVGCANRRALTAGCAAAAGAAAWCPARSTCWPNLRRRAVGVRRGALGRLVLLRRGQLALDLGRVDLRRLGRGVELGDLRQAPVRVGVAVRVLDLDEAAEALGDADLGHAGVADRDHRRAGVGVDREPAAVRALHGDGGVGALLLLEVLRR